MLTPSPRAAAPPAVARRRRARGRRQQLERNLFLLDAVAPDPLGEARPRRAADIGKVHAAGRGGPGRWNRGSARRRRGPSSAGEFSQARNALGVARSNGSGGSGPFPLLGGNHGVPVEAAHARGHGHARGQRAPAVRLPAMFVRDRRARGSSRYSSQIRASTGRSLSSIARPVALVLAEEPGLARIEAAEMKEAQRRAVDDVACRRRSVSRARAGSSRRRCSRVLEDVVIEEATARSPTHAGR